MVVVFSISGLALGVVAGIGVAILFMFFGGIAGIGERVDDFANEKTFYILVFLAVIICIISFICVLIKSKNTREFLHSIIPVLLITASLSISLTNVWTMIAYFFEVFTEIHDTFLLVIIGWFLLLVGAIFYGAFSLLFLASGFVPLYIGSYFEEKYKRGNIAVILSSIPIIVINLLVLLNASPYFVNSIAHIF